MLLTSWRRLWSTSPLLKRSSTQRRLTCSTSTSRATLQALSSTSVPSCRPCVSISLRSNMHNRPSRFWNEAHSSSNKAWRNCHRMTSHPKWGSATRLSWTKNGSIFQRPQLSRFITLQLSLSIWVNGRRQRLITKKHWSWQADRWNRLTLWLKGFKRR